MDDAGAAVPRGREAIIGIGNVDRGDDAIGRVVARRLRARQLPSVDVFEDDGDAANLLSFFESAETVYVVDAAVSGAEPGIIRRFDVTTAPLPQTISMLSTHGVGLAAAVELARVLKRLPRRCIVYTVEAKECTMGASLTPAVEAAVAEVIARLCAEIA